MQTFYEKGNERIKQFEKIEVNGEVAYRETADWKKFMQREGVRKRLEVSNLPSHVLDLSFDDYIGNQEKIRKIKIYLEKFEEKFKRVNLYFWSEGNTTQKTTVAGILGKELTKKGFSVKFILMNNLLKLLSNEQYEKDENKIKLSQEVRACDFLIIDDSFDPKKATIYRSGFQIPFLDEFLRTRLEVEKKATCFTSNFALEDIDVSVFGESLKHLMLRSIPDPFYFETPFHARLDFNPDDLWS